MSTPTASTSPALNQSDTTDLYMLLKDMKSNTLTDYAVPGLESSLLKNGLFRLFEANRDIEELIQPHSHRFDFMCIVLNGTVENTLYLEAPYNPRIVDSVNQWSRRELKRSTKDGFDGYLLSDCYELKGYRTRKVTYASGQVYGMLHSQIHSIKFSRGLKCYSLKVQKSGILTTSFSQSPMEKKYLTSIRQSGCSNRKSLLRYKEIPDR